MKEGWTIKKLGDICKVAPSKNRAKVKDIDPLLEVSFMPMEDLTIGNKYAYPSKRLLYKDIASGYTYFEEGDILIAKVTPCFENGKLAIVKKLAHGIGFGSSEYIVIRNSAQEIISDYIYYYLRTDVFRQNGKKLMVGACGLKRIPKEYIASLSIPFPILLQEQQRIVKILDAEFAKIDALKANAEKSLQAAKDLFRTILKEKFNNNSWQLSTIGVECKTGAGGTPNKMYKEYYEGGDIPWLRSGEVCSRNIYNTELFITQAGVDNSSAKWFPKSTVVVAMYGATAGQVGILQIPSTTNQAVCGIFPNKKYLPDFIYYVILSQKEYLVAQATGNAQSNISQKKIKGVSIPIIEIGDQKRIVSQLDNLDECCKVLQENYNKTIVLCEDLKQTLLRKAFNGEL